MATAREILQLIITGDGKQAVAEMKKVGATASTELGSAQRSAAMVGTSMMKAGGIVAAGGAAVVYGLKQASDAYVDAGRETLKLQRLTGGTAEDMSRLRYVAQATGVGVDTLSTAVVRLSKSSQGSAGKSALADLGVDLTDAEGNTRPVVDVISDLATKFEALPNGIEKNAAALKLFGRGGADLIPLLNRGGDAIDALAASADQLGFTLDQRDLDNVKAYVKAQREMSASFEALQIQLGKNVFPVFAEILERTTSAASGTAEAVNDLPGPLKETLGVIVALTGVTAIAGGSLVFFSGAATKASATLKAADGTLNGYGRALGVVTTATLALAAAQAGLSLGNAAFGFDRTQSDDINRAVAAATDGEAALSAFTDATVTQAKKLSLADGPKLFASYLDILGQSMVSLPGLENLQTAADAQEAFDKILSSSPEAATATLNAYEAYTAGLDHNSREYKANTDFINRNRESMALAASAADELAGSQGQVGDAAAGATSRLAAMNYELSKTSNQAGAGLPGLEQYAKDIGDLTNPYLDLADANDRLREAEEKAADVASMSSKDIVDANRNVASARRSLEDANRNLADAQKDLNDVLNDDPMFGLKSVSPEQEIADARNRLAEANRRLAANPGDAIALTMRDEAIMDLEDANQRAQDEKRNAAQRAEDIDNARKRVSDAERGVQDATVGLSDAQQAYNDTLAKHGTNSQEYADASRDVIRAQMDVQQSTADLAQYLVDNGITSVDQMNTQLDRWVALGGPVGAAAQQMKDSLDPLVGQAINLAAALQAANTAAATLAKQQPPIWAFDILLNPAAAAAAGGSSSATFGKPSQATRGRAPNGGANFGVPVPPGFGAGRGSATGGLITGPGTGTSDDIPTWLSNGEYVIPADKVALYGVQFFDDIKKGGKVAKFATGGLVGSTQRIAVPDQRMTFQQHRIATTQATTSTRKEGDLNMGGVVVQLAARDDQLAGAAVVASLRNIARRSGRGLRVAEKMG